MVVWPWPALLNARFGLYMAKRHFTGGINYRSYYLQLSRANWTAKCLRTGSFFCRYTHRVHYSKTATRISESPFATTRVIVILFFFFLSQQVIWKNCESVGIMKILSSDIAVFSSTAPGRSNSKRAECTCPASVSFRNSDKVRSLRRWPSSESRVRESSILVSTYLFFESRQKISSNISWRRPAA